MFWNIKCFLYAKRFMNDCCFLTLNTRLLNESMRDLSSSKTLINFKQIIVIKESSSKEQII